MNKSTGCIYGNYIKGHVLKKIGTVIIRG